ncbi:hypothetical protein CERSUDRAFT_117467 [Gelatoporia subvermispora B]|uniref:Condensation domain-containing protein n=1 Tax=Ceriporiopsis subvermispora (strain B) TaxID=914234 RepID=M2PDQ4_CERS8|nr:hypothetical protein CERSUDRAFT_117467 [Gelatoporia subvermispora B]
MDVTQEPQWEHVSWRSESPNAYTRPLLGSELLADQGSVLEDGYGEGCIGLTFTSTLPDAKVHERLRVAMAHLRFKCPLIAASLERGIHDSQLRSWVYVPVKDMRDLQNWLDEVTVVVPEQTDPTSFMESLSLQRLPYILKDGGQLILRCYLVQSGNAPDRYTIIFHGVHSIIDAKPTLDAFSLIFKSLANPGYFPGLGWGQEWKQLPVGPITATGGPREGWDTAGVSLFAKLGAAYENPTPSHSLLCKRIDIAVPGKSVKAEISFSDVETRRITSVLKEHGFSVTHLIEAAHALAIFQLNPVSIVDAETAHVSYLRNVISLAKFFAPQYSGKINFVSAFVLIPVSFHWKDVAAAVDDKARLLAAMQLDKAQYEEYLANPCLPHLMAQQMQLAPPRERMFIGNPLAPILTNPGVIEDRVAPEWFDPSEPGKPPLFKIQDFHIHHRLTAPAPMGHAWTMNGRLHVQLVATDNWEKAELQAGLDEMKRQILLLVE